MSSAEATAWCFSAFAEVAEALAHRHRLEILEQLAQGESSIEALVERIGLSIANTSQRLRLMRRAGLFASRRDGTRIFYRLSDSTALEAGAALQRVAERNLAEVREVIGGCFRQRAASAPSTRAELTRRVKDRVVTLLDARPHDEYDAGHLPEAINMRLCSSVRFSRRTSATSEFMCVAEPNRTAEHRN